MRFSQKESYEGKLGCIRRDVTIWTAKSPSSQIFWSYYETTPIDGDTECRQAGRLLTETSSQALITVQTSLSIGKEIVGFPKTNKASRIGNCVINNYTWFILHYSQQCCMYKRTLLQLWSLFLIRGIISVPCLNSYCLQPLLPLGVVIYKFHTHWWRQDHRGQLQALKPF